MKSNKIITLAAVATLFLASACRKEPLSVDGQGSQAGAVVTRIAPKPQYTDLSSVFGGRSVGVDTRTSTATGDWQVGDQVRATITFYADDKGENQLSVAEQMLTYVDYSYLTWDASPSMVTIPISVRSMRVSYIYESLPDEFTLTREGITGHVASATGLALPEEPFTPTADNNYLIPIADALGYLSIDPAFERNTALVSVLMKAGQEVELSTSYAQPAGTLVEGTYRLSAINNGAKPATAYFHLNAPAVDAAAGATFRLGFKDNAISAYPAVPFRTGWQYALDTYNIIPGGDIGDGGDKQFVTASGLTELDTEVFNAKNAVWVITGGGTESTDVTVVNNVKAALVGLPAGSIDLVLTAVKTINADAFKNNTALASVNLPSATAINPDAFLGCTALQIANLPSATILDQNAFSDCAALAVVNVPLAVTIGMTAFYECKALIKVKLPSATGVGSRAFYGCTNLATVIAPKATNMESGMFENCPKLTRVELTAKGALTLSTAFYGFTTSTACTLVLNKDKKTGSTGSPTVSGADGKTWGTKSGSTSATWSVITFVSDSGIPFTDNITLPGVGEDGPLY